MAMPPGGTFDYVVVVPSGQRLDRLECLAVLRKAVAPSGDPLRDRRLVGHTPLVQITDAGLTPDPSAERPRVLRSRITLRAADRPAASVREASLVVDRALISCLQPGDELCLSRTADGGLGVSIIRAGQLVGAAGAITAVPLGSAVEASIPHDLVRDAEAIFAARAPGFHLPEYPIEVAIGGGRAILCRGKRTFGDYRLVVVHGHLPGLPGNAPCAALWHSRTCPDVAATASAMLLDQDDALTMSQWP